MNAQLFLSRFSQLLRPVVFLGYFGEVEFFQRQFLALRPELRLVRLERPLPTDPLEDRVLEDQHEDEQEREGDPDEPFAGGGHGGDIWLF